jgi:hypothetical protein
VHDAVKSHGTGSTTPNPAFERTCRRRRWSFVRHSLKRAAAQLTRLAIVAMEF